MSHLTFKEHLFLMEARKKGGNYTEKRVKDVLERVTLTLSGSESANMTRLAKRYARLEVSIKAMKEKHDEMNAMLKNDVADLFNAEDIILTRVVETASFTLQLAKEVKKTKGTVEVDYESIMTALIELIPNELQAKVEEITKKYTKDIPAKDPVKKLTVSKEVVKEGIRDLAKWAASFLKSVTSWAMRYDSKLDRLKAKAGLA